MEYIDQINHNVNLAQKPQRIVSIVPSQTELLYDLGLDDRVVGITKFCIHPNSWFRSKTRVGGTKRLNIDKIKSLKPDLIIANKEENERDQIELLQKLFPVWTSDIATLEDSLNMIADIGNITGTEKKAVAIIGDIRKEFDVLKNCKTVKTVLYLIWRDPYMSIGKDTFIHDMLTRCKFKNVLSEKLRYPSVLEEEIKEYDPDIIMLSSEPYPFKKKHISEFKKLNLRSTILLVDGELFSWYGSRLKYSVSYFVDLIRQIS